MKGTKWKCMKERNVQRYKEQSNDKIEEKVAQLKGSSSTTVTYSEKPFVLLFLIDWALIRSSKVSSDFLILLQFIMPHFICHSERSETFFCI